MRNQMKRLTSVRIVMVGALVLAASCSDDTTPTPDTGVTADAAADTVIKTDAGCTSGATQACVCSNGTKGEQTCSKDGASWEACRCEEKVSKTVTSAGGSLTLNGAKIEIPAGALKTPQEITITITKESAPTGYEAYSAVYLFEPKGLIFEKPVSVTLPSNGDAALAVMFWSRKSGTGYDQIEGTISSGSIAADIAHFSKGFSGKRQKEANISAGTFTMGAPTTEMGFPSSETQHKVTLTNAIAMMKYEVTEKEFKDLMGYSPLKAGTCDACPITGITWDTALAFCNALSKSQSLPECFDCTGKGRDGSQGGFTCRLKTAYSGNGGKDYYKCKGYRLPTEAEWEYAYRAGTTTAFYNGSMASRNGQDPNLDKIGWYRENSSGTLRPVGQLAANAWGLYDMAGNAYEWVWDWWVNKPLADETDPVGPTATTRRAFRGGAASRPALECRAAARGGQGPSGGDLLGIRPCRSR